MVFVEVVFENGSSSIMEVLNKEEALSALRAHHERAKKGELNGPQGAPSDRIAKAFTYDRHPSDYNPEDTLTADELNTALKDLVKNAADPNGVVSVGQLAVDVRNLSHPMVDVAGPQDSKYKMESNGEITSAEIDAGGTQSSGGGK